MMSLQKEQRAHVGYRLSVRRKKMPPKRETRHSRELKNSRRREHYAAQSSDPEVRTARRRTWNQFDERRRRTESAEQRECRLEKRRRAARARYRAALATADGKERLREKNRALYQAKLKRRRARGARGDHSQLTSTTEESCESSGGKYWFQSARS